MVHGKDRPTEEATRADAGTRPNEVARTRLVLLSDDETPSVSLVAARLRHIQQLVALLFLLRVADDEYVPVAALLLQTGNGKQIVNILPFELQIRAAGQSAFWAELLIYLPDPSKVADAVGAAAAAALLAAQWISKKGRGFYWKDKSAETEIKQLEAEIKKFDALSAAAKAKTDAARALAEVAKAGVEARMVPFNAVLDGEERIEKLQISEEQKNVFRAALIASVDGIFGEGAAQEIRRLPPPKPEGSEATPPQPAKPRKP